MFQAVSSADEPKQEFGPSIYKLDYLQMKTLLDEFARTSPLHCSFEFRAFSRYFRGLLEVGDNPAIS